MNAATAYAFAKKHKATSTLVCTKSFPTLKTSSECFIPQLATQNSETPIFSKTDSVVTGMRFRMFNGIMHLQIQEGKMLESGAIDATTVRWVPVDEFKRDDKGVENGVDYHTLTWEDRKFAMDDLQEHENHVVTGVILRIRQNYLNLEVRLTPVHDSDGFLKEHRSKWISNAKRTRWVKHNWLAYHPKNNNCFRSLHLLDLSDVPTKTVSKSVPTKIENHYIEFTHTDFVADLGLSTIPFIDIQDVVTIPPVALSGAGIYHKGQPGYGGFLAPRLITKDLSPKI